jgi:hypothetical protein
LQVGRQDVRSTEACISGAELKNFSFGWPSALSVACRAARSIDQEKRREKRRSEKIKFRRKKVSDGA